MEMIILFKCFIISILFHIIDDFVLQPICLSKLKQKTFWLKHEQYCDKYRNDYKMALLIHCISWSIITMLPLLFISDNIILLVICLYLNITIHYITDDYKANKLKINLVQDQTIHFLQILITYLIFLI